MEVSGAAAQLADDRRLDEERAEVWALALELHAQVTHAVAGVASAGPLREEAARAALGAAAWIAEASGRPSGFERRHFLLTARAAVLETAELLDRLRVRRLLADEDHRAARRTIVALLAHLAPG